MRQSNHAIRGALAGAALLLTGAGVAPVYAQVSAMDYDAIPNCQAFRRSPAGAWTAIAPTMLNIDNGMQLSFRPGDSMGPGSEIAGVAVPIILDRHCGNL